MLERVDRGVWSYELSFRVALVAGYRSVDRPASGLRSQDSIPDTFSFKVFVRRTKVSMKRDVGDVLFYLR